MKLLNFIAAASIAVAVAACQTSGSSTSTNTPSAVDLVIAEVKRANDVATLCRGGEASVRPAVGAAVGRLASQRKITGDYNAIGERAGAKFGREECR